MSKFNTTLTRPKTLTINKAGGEAYKESDKLALVSLLLTSFVNNEFYRSADDSLKDLKNHLSKVDPEFAAKAAIFARDEFGMRSISHALAGELASYSSGKEWSKNFYDKVVVRVDDMLEILSYYLNNKTDKKSPKFPNSLKKGFAKAFDKFDAYQLAKYRGENKEIKLVDLVNIVHPVPTDRNKLALESLIKGGLKSTETWEAKLSEAGQKASETGEDLSKLKADAWGELIGSKKIGYFALLRNLRNIINQAPGIIPQVCELLQNEQMVKGSRILPFRFKTAYDEIGKLGSSKEVRDVQVAISKALDISVSNVPKFEGETLIALDTSGSMRGRAHEIAGLFTAVLAKANNCDVMTFDTTAKYESYNPLDSVMTIKNSFSFNGGGTNFHNIFKVANKKYDRVIILSDMQGWMGHYTPKAAYNDYKNKFGANPFIYSWDMAGLGTLQFPESNVFCLAGFSDKVLDIMKWLESDRNEMFKRIESINI